MVSEYSVKSFSGIWISAKRFSAIWQMISEHSTFSIRHVGHLPFSATVFDHLAFGQMIADHSAVGFVLLTFRLFGVWLTGVRSKDSVLSNSYTNLAHNLDMAFIMLRELYQFHQMNIFFYFSTFPSKFEWII